MYLETSKDILYIALASSVVLVTIFLCWAIYYVARILGEAYHLVTDIRRKLEVLEKLLSVIREKIEQSSSYLRLIVDGAIAATQYFRARQDEDTGGEKKKKKQ